MKRLLLRFSAGILILLVMLGGFWYWINIPPKVDIPTPQMPDPNGYDYFIKAGEAVVRDEKGVDKTTDTKWKEGKQYPIAPKEAWIQENAPALQLLREGLKYPAWHQPMRSLYGKNPDFAQFRELMRLMIVESNVYAERGDWQNAANSALDVIDFGHAIPRGTPLIPYLDGTSIRAVGIRELGELIPHLTASEARDAAHRLEKIYGKNIPLYQVLQEEKWHGQAWLIEAMQGKNWRKSFFLMLNDPYFQLPKRENRKVFILRKQTLLDNYSRVMDAQIANARLPYPEGKSYSGLAGRSFVEFMPADFERTYWNQGRINTYSVLTTAMLALHAYKLESGNYPDNLQKLVPAYLQKVPIDPFDGTQPLRYKLSGEKYFLWSIGPDGIDDNAAPIENKERKGKARHRLLDMEDKGDVVAGINMP